MLKIKSLYKSLKTKQLLLKNISLAHKINKYHLSFKDKKCDTLLLFFTYADENYFEFAITYPFFALIANPEAKVEIVLSNYNLFKKKYSHFIEFYNTNQFFKDKVIYRQVNNNFNDIRHGGAIRFLEHPITVAKYVYIGDIDILILENILHPHLDNIKKNNLDYSNIVRPNTKRLSGLHFINYQKMYPIKITSIMDIINMNDEELLYKIMYMKGLRTPSESLTYRPVFGVHISYYSRPPLKNFTTGDKLTKFVSWGPYRENYLTKYFEIKNSTIGNEFFQTIKETDIKLRRIIQFIEITFYYIKNNNLCE